MGKKERIKFKDEIIYMFKYENLTLSRIANRLNINRKDVRDVLVENELYIFKPRYSAKNDINTINKIIHMYKNEKKTLKQISKELSIGVNLISKILKDNDVTIRKASEYNRIYYSNDNGFSEYTPESVYWAGFITGDGCIFSHGLADTSINNSLTVTLAYKDRPHLEKLKNFFQYSGVLYNDKNKNKITLNINNLNIVKDLEQKYNITKQKTNTYQPPDNIPNELVKYFVLGLFDADGCITRCNRPNVKHRNIKGKYVYSISFTGTYETCEYIRKFFNSKVKLVKRKNNNTNNYTVIFQGNKQVIKYLSRLYNNISVKFCLERKYKMYCDLLKQYNISRP